MLLVSAAAVPGLVGTAGCRSSQVFAGPDPLADPPRPPPEVITLQAVIAAEEAMIRLYRAAVAGDREATARSLVSPLLLEHEEHLAQLRARLVLPPGTRHAQTSPGTAPGAARASAVQVTAARLRAAERASAARLVSQLATVEPALAQLFASIAASDATHVQALGG
jgi:hypothetical protein